MRPEGWWSSPGEPIMQFGIPGRTRSTGTGIRGSRLEVTGRAAQGLHFIGTVVLTSSRGALTMQSGRDGRQPLMATGFLQLSRFLPNNFIGSAQATTMLFTL